MSDPGKKKTINPLELPSIAGGERVDFAEKEDSWDDPPADIPDRPSSPDDLAPVFDIPMRISAVLGKSTMKVDALTKLGRGAVIELDRKVGEAIDLYINNRLVARGEVVVVDDKLGVTMTEIFKSARK